LEHGTTQRRHPSDLRSLPSAFQDTNYRVSRYSTFKSPPNYHNAYSNFHNSSNTFRRSPFLEDSSIYVQTNVLRTVNDPLDSWLQNLRRWVEIKRLTGELSSTPIQQPYLLPYNGAIYQSNKYQSFQPSFRIEDLEIIGYKGYVCKECLTAHPLAIYRNKYQTSTIIHTKHRCNNRRKLEILQRQQKGNEGSVLANLYMNVHERIT
jgi:hypothetical protein